MDIVVPICEGREAAQRCLASLQAAACRTASEIVVVDDASTDALLTKWLDDEAAQGRITLLRHPTKRGFAAAVNSGFGLHPRRDVTLLGADCEVANDWLDRLLACLYAQADIGAATPFCNDAALCAYPFCGWDGGMPGVLGQPALDALVGGVNAGQWLEIPSAERFCMAVRRECLDAVGFFDAERFGAGGGEEKDFCRRAVAVGWRSALAANVFVRRDGGGPSVDLTRIDAEDLAARTLSALHPDFDAAVREFLWRDAPAALRARLDRARVEHGGAEFAAVMDEQARWRVLRAQTANPPRRQPLPTLLHVVNGCGGGARWVRDFCAADLECRNLVLRGRGSRNDTATDLMLIDPALGAAPLMTWTLTRPVRGTAIEHPEYAAIVQWICTVFEARAVIVSSLVGHALDVLRLPLPVVLVTHDLYPFCPARWATFGEPCTRCGDDELARCMDENPYNTFWHVASARDWQTLRAAFAARLAASNVRVVAPDEDVHARWVALFPQLGIRPWTCIPHGLGAAFARGAALAPAAADGDDEASTGVKTPPSARLRVLIPGQLLPHKGLWLWREICDGLREFADVLLLGCGEFGLPFAELDGIEVEPNCDLDDLPRKVARWRPDCALLLSVLPESFGYSLAEMQALAVPTVATRVGSYVERVDNGWNGFLVDPQAEAVLDLLRALDRARDRLATVVDILRFNPVRTAYEMVADYHRLLPELDAPVVGAAAETLLATLAKRLHAQDEIARLRDLVQARDEEARQRALNQRRLESMIATIARQHASILLSPSWKAGAPLRALLRLWDSLRRKFAPSGKPEVVRPRHAENRPTLPRGDAPVPILLRSRAAARYWLCEAIGAPDDAVIVVGGGAGVTQRALRSFIALADVVTRRSTRACFVWCGRTVELPPDDALAMRLLREVRDLFVLDTQLEAEVFAGADLLLLPATGEDGAPVRATPDIPRVELPLEPPDAGVSGVAAVTVTQLLQFCEGTEQTDAPQG
ncbi:MAG: glycosyltransferase [Azoarcus sp.]|nr:glycosyltransferase [Azoarcus sp.]